MVNKLIIKRPSRTEVEAYLKRWDSRENYVSQESSLRKLFTKTYPLNSDLDDVLIKVCVLNALYYTGILSPFPVAKHIVALKIDDYLAKGDLLIVEKIAEVKMNKETTRNNYSFATKYCSHHRPLVYLIYDSYVEKILVYFREKDTFSKFTKHDLRSYPLYKKVHMDFRKFYDLESFNLKQIDQYLWQLGKEFYLKKY